jgi:hypothetical protein
MNICEYNKEVYPKELCSRKLHDIETWNDPEEDGRICSVTERA